MAAVFFLAATFLGTAFLRTVALAAAGFFFFALALAFFLVAMEGTSTLKTVPV
jgi:hypothetical protein